MLPYVSVDTLHWTLSAIIQAMAMLLGLVLIVYVLILDRADRSLDLLQAKQAVVARQVAPILPELVQGWADMQSADPYWHATQRKLVDLSRYTSGLDWARQHQADLHPEKFLNTLQSITNLAPLEPGFPQKSLLSEYRREYEARLSRHVRIVECSRWAYVGPGRLLPLLLGFTLILGIGLLSVCSQNWPQWLLVFASGAILVAAVACVWLVLLVAWRLLTTLHWFSSPS